MSWRYVTLLTAAFLLGLFPVYFLLASHGVNTIPVLISNLTGSDAVNAELPFNLSSQSLIDGEFMNDDGLDVEATDADESVGYMPGTDRVQVLSCYDNSSADETTDCNDAGASDITLPTTGSEVFEFAFDNQAKHLWVNTGTIAVATTWDCTWKYWDGSAYQDLSGVVDGTDCFQVSGLQRVTWDFPAEGLWPESTLHSVEGYWVEVEIDAGAAGVSQVPLGTQAWYETGRWWVLADAIVADEQKSYELHLGTSATTGSGTFSIATSADGGTVRGDDAAYPPAFDSSTNTDGDCATGDQDILRSLVAAVYKIQDCLLRFNTSTIPVDAQVESGSLDCTTDAFAPLDVDSRSLVGEWYQWQTLSGANYQTTAQNNAHTGTTLASISTLGTNQPISFDLTNLENVNKSGVTGLRLAISGSTPTGANQAGILDCSLSLTWSQPSQFQWYVPHEDGYALTDNASLEPGDNFEITIAGYFDMESVAAGFISKGTDLQLRVNTSGNLNILRNGASAGNASLASGYHVITLTQGGSAAADQLVLLTDGAERVSTSAAAITDNATDWEFAANGNPDAMDYIQYEVNNAVVFMHQIQDIPGFELVNHENPGTFDAIARYPDTIDGFSASVLSAVASPGDNPVDVAPGDTIGDQTAIDNFSEIPSPSAGDNFLREIAGSSAWNFEPLAILLGVGVVLVLTIAGWRLFQGAVLGAAIGLEIGLCMAFFLSLWPFYPIILGIFPILAILLKDRIMA